MSLKSKLKLNHPIRPAGREPQSIKAIILNKSRTSYTQLSILIPVWQGSEGRSGETKGPRAQGAAEAEKAIKLFC